MSEADETRDGVALTNLDQPLSDRDDATKRDLVDYLDAVREPIIGQLRDRPLSVIRVRPGQPPFMQKNLPRYTPEWVRRVPVWAEASHREISYALCDDRRTLLWFANQRALARDNTPSRPRPHPGRAREHRSRELGTQRGTERPTVMRRRAGRPGQPR
ncbi:hypothetical protein [Micromonospora sp. NPDC005197]|uniref:non-homologous end-joining DNA ligase LigD n=1 Tax=Micromonospora sp. NPDC005197 TaxID=3157020 RepID=UPI0033AE360A